MSKKFDVVVAGAGIGGMCAAISAARMGVKVLLIEMADEIGGTGVHSPVGIVCTFRDAKARPINIGLHQEFFPHVYDMGPERVVTYDENDLKQRYLDAIQNESTLTVWKGTAVTKVLKEAGTISSISTSGQVEETVEAKVFVDCTADGNLGFLAGAEYKKGRESDGAMQPSTLTFKVGPVDFSRFKAQHDLTTWQGIEPIYKELSAHVEKCKAEGLCGNHKNGVLFFKCPNEDAAIFNQTRIFGVDPTDPESMTRSYEEGERQVQEFLKVLHGHPAFAESKLIFVSKKLGVREGRRIVGDYILTAEDCLAELRCEDMIAACSYAIDIHNPQGGDTRMEWIPGSGYYHIPYRCIVAKGFSNLLMGSRCISGTHEAHSSYRVMSSLSAIGEAAGKAAALTTLKQCRDVRDVSARDIRTELAKVGQFVEEI